MRDTAEETFDGTAVIQAKTFVSDGGGDGTATWSPSGTVACHISPVSGLEREIAERITSDADWVVTVPALTTVTPRNRVVVAGTTYNIEAARAPRTWELTRRLEVTELVP